MDTTSAPSVAAQAVVKKKMPPIGFWTHRQGAAVWIGLVWGIYCFFFNPHATTAVEGALWIFIPAIFIFGFYLGVTQMLPVITAPIFESHFATLKDIGVSIWVPIPIAVMAILAMTLGTMEIAWVTVDVDMTLIEIGVSVFFAIAFALDILFGSVFTIVKNRLASEAGMARMPEN